ncbi:MAG: sulfatase family protein [Vicinamibacterales bacterium]
MKATARIRLTLIVAVFISAASLGMHRQTSTAPTPARPNILFAIADDWSFGHAGAYGTTWVRTPAFDRVARDGVLFTHAYTPNAKCAPSRAILLTGRQSWQLEEAANHVPFFPTRFKTWAEAIGEHGYVTGSTGKGWGPGVANDVAGKPRQMTGRPFNRHKSEAPTGQISGNDYAANFRDFLSTAPKGQPWSFWYGSLEPHRGYEYGSGVSRGGKKPTDIGRVPAYWPDNETVRNDMLDYAYEVEHFDRHLGRMLDALTEAGALDNTIVIVTSDNGMPFPRAKGQTYPLSNHVPLAIMWRNGIKVSGRTVEDYISFVDLAPTLVEVAGLKWEESGMQPAAGDSLVRILRSPQSRVAPRRDHVLLGKERHDVGRPQDAGYPIRGIIREDMLYLRNYEPDRWPAGNPETGYLNCDGSPTKTDILQRRRDGRDIRAWTLAFGRRPPEELYDLARDPFCMTNLASDRQHGARLQRLRTQMERELRAQGDPRMFGRGDVFDRHVYAEEKTRNFYERFARGDKPTAGWVNESDFEKTPVK